MGDEKPIIPITLDVNNNNEVNKCFRPNCGSVNNLLYIEEDFENENLGKYICVDCLRKNRTYKLCEKDGCDTVFNVRHREGKCKDFCTECNEKTEIEESHDFED